MAFRSAFDELDELGRPISLLPSPYRWVGAGVAVFGASAFVVLVSVGYVAWGQYAGGTITMLGLAISAFSREPTEDELTRKLRLEAAYWSIMVGIFMLMGANTMAFVIDGVADFFTGTALMCAILGYYLVRFHSARRSLGTSTASEK